MTIAPTELTASPAALVGETAASAEGTLMAREIGLSWDDPRWLTDTAELERRCRAYLEILRWPEGVICPRCQSSDTRPIPARKKFYCRSCRYHFSVTAGTVFHNSHLPLWKWFLTVSVMLSSEGGVPSNQLVNLLGGSYKTAWFVQHRVRAAVREAARGEECLNAESVRARHVRQAVAERRGQAGASPRLYARPLVGPYHGLSVKHAHAYVAEIEWRASLRHRPSAFRETVLCLLASEPLEFEELTGHNGRRAPALDATMTSR
jgi:transposase-like protein